MHNAKVILSYLYLHKSYFEKFTVWQLTDTSPARFEESLQKTHKLAQIKFTIIKEISFNTQTEYMP